MKLWPFGRKRPAAVRHEELPIPACLRPFLVPADGKCSMTEVAGSVRCTCGQDVFTAHRSVDCDCLYHLACHACGQDVLLFDAEQHGWDRLVCGEPVVDAQAGEHTEQCRKCGCGDFRADVWLEACDREEFLQNAPEGIAEGAWVNAFTYFAAHLTCTQCGCRVRSWADIETA